jgi:hypothetical protein
MAKTPKELAKENLEKATALFEIYKSDHFQKYLLPYLELLSYPEKIRPDSCATRDEYLHKIEVANIKAQVYDDFLKFMKGQEDYIKKLHQILKEPVKNFSIGDALQTIEKATSIK